MIKNLVEYFNKLWYSIFRIGKVEVINMSTINNDLEEKAKNILVSNDMLKLPVNLAQIAKNNNIDVYTGKLPNGISGAIRYNSKKEKFEILIEERESNVRQRFTLAHELAHYFLEKGRILASGEIHFDPLFRKETNYDEREVEYLAGAILMNKEILEKLYKINSSTKELAKVFDVSESAMTVRLSKLKLQ